MISRRAAGYSVDATAAALDIGKSTVRAHENGQNGFPVGKAKAYAELYGVSLEWLLNGDGSPEQTLKQDAKPVAEAARLKAALRSIRARLQKLIDEIDELEVG